MQWLLLACIQFCACTCIFTRVCDPQQLGLKDFTGYRVQLQTTSGFQYNNIRLSFCSLGRSDNDDAYYPVSDPLRPQIPWGRKICAIARTSQRQMRPPRCFLMARRTSLLEKDQSSSTSNPLYFPGTWLGGLYACPGDSETDGIDCNSTSATPLRPLIADNPLNVWTEVPDGRHTVQRTPIAYTFMDMDTFSYGPRGISRFRLDQQPPLDWSQEIDIDAEVYQSDTL